jgi:hypothetical protein
MTRQQAINYLASSGMTDEQIAEVVKAIKRTETHGDLVSRSYLLSEYDRQHKGPAGGARKIIEEAPSAEPEKVCIANITLSEKQIREAVEKAKSGIIQVLPSTEPETCEGCKHLGKWEDEVEYGYPSPCTRCKRRAEDNYER